MNKLSANKVFDEIPSREEYHYPIVDMVIYDEYDDDDDLGLEERNGKQFSTTQVFDDFPERDDNDYPMIDQVLYDNYKDDQQIVDNNTISLRSSFFELEEKQFFTPGVFDKRPEWDIFVDEVVLDGYDNDHLNFDKDFSRVEKVCAAAKVLDASLVMYYSNDRPFHVLTKEVESTLVPEKLTDIQWPDSLQGIESLDNYFKPQHEITEGSHLFSDIASLSGEVNTCFTTIPSLQPDNQVTIVACTSSHKSCTLLNSGHTVVLHDSIIAAMKFNFIVCLMNSSSLLGELFDPGIIVRELDVFIEMGGGRMNIECSEETTHFVDNNYVSTRENLEKAMKNLHNLCNSLASIVDMSRYDSTLDANGVSTVTVEGKRYCSELQVNELSANELFDGRPDSIENNYFTVEKVLYDDYVEDDDYPIDSHIFNVHALSSTSRILGIICVKSLIDMESQVMNNISPTSQLTFEATNCQINGVSQRPCTYRYPLGLPASVGSHLSSKFAWTEFLNSPVHQRHFDSILVWDNMLNYEQTELKYKAVRVTFIGILWNKLWDPGIPINVDSFTVTSGLGGLNMATRYYNKQFIDLISEMAGKERCFKFGLNIFSLYLVQQSFSKEVSQFNDPFDFSCGYPQ
ncbi:hypothetical protein LIER_14297 [Lithospermum erythrorhizon]|uniref:Uncharacterized protein n=1 Tax=Lithospermum erythrorhizon TaxID=34254 RepID=A0AAV3PYM5_LITER